MQSLTLLALAATMAPLALARPQDQSTDADNSGYTLPSSVPASEVLAGIYGTNIPTKATGAVATSLASAVYSYEETLVTDAAYKSVADAVYMAAATASDSDAIFSQIEGVGAVNAPYTTADWYKSGVPASAQTAFASYLGQYKAVESSVLGGATGSATGTTTSGGAAKTTGTATKETGTASSDAASSSTSSGGAFSPMVTGKAMAGLAVGVALGVAAAL
ncbi:Uu.00g123010.m01.CDS01 [Anthostomella pinea]|uniref:Uu.00g123010.m01.CDS01 n=1 Tax=Anthostomella pinea TaxID=933095 RepID=A0AAI8YHL2_9PEZI|nr:Uu.00g123010.m01.CDS01 [Anthostomella pinea]